MSDAGLYVTDTTNHTWLPVRASDFVTDKGTFNTMWNEGYVNDIRQVTGISTVSYSKKFGLGIVVGSNTLTSNVSANKWTTIATLPTGYRPVFGHPFLAYFGNIMCIGLIETSGVIHIYSQSQLLASSGNPLSFNTMYLI